MPMWGKSDAASNSVLWAPAKFNKAPNTANRNALYGNTTADAFVTGQTVGMYAVDSTEIEVGSYKLSAVTANGAGSSGSYVPGDVLTIENTGANVTTGATARVTGTKVRTVTKVAGGTGYANGDTVTCNTGTMTTNAVFTVTTGAADTIIASLALTTNGVFTANPTLTGGALKNLVVGNTSANGATATVTMGIASLAVQNPGNYSVVPTDVASNDATGGSGTGANLVLTFASSSKGVTHTGWIVRQVGTGGRAGRVQHEVLVAGGIGSDGSDDDLFPDS